MTRWCEGRSSVRVRVFVWGVRTDHFILCLWIYVWCKIQRQSTSLHFRHFTSTFWRTIPFLFTIFSFRFINVVHYFLTQWPIERTKDSTKRKVIVKVYSTVSVPFPLYTFSVLFVYIVNLYFSVFINKRNLSVIFLLCIQDLREKNVKKGHIPFSLFRVHVTHIKFCLR